MKYLVSDFYHIRFFNPGILPISINSGEPKWYHDYKGRNYIFRDKRNVVNGLYMSKLSMDNIETPNDISCDTCVKKNRCYKDLGEMCPICIDHYNYLKTLNFKEITNNLEEVSKVFNCDEICIVVFEKEYRKCGEAVALLKWFKKNGIKVEDFK